MSYATVRRYFVALLGLVFAITYHSFNPVSLKTQALRTTQLTACDRKFTPQSEAISFVKIKVRCSAIMS